MEELLRGALPFLVPAMAPVLAILWAPLLGRRGRLVLAVVLVV
ncbi:MAG: hypothetical protein AAF628_33430 [Planctomycetota bacterium]